jgi:mannose-6-phosphate isomerase-like protein (cupin superfamily)
MAERSIVGVALAGVFALALAGVLPGLDGSAHARAAKTKSERSVKSEGMVKGFVGDISQLTESNADFRHVLYTGKHLQLVLMTLKPGEDIGEETHEGVDQFFRIEEGTGEAVIDGRRSSVKAGDAILVPAGARHNIVDTGKKPLRFYTLYGPPEHEDRTVHVTKKDAATAKEHFDGKTTESVE